MSKQIASSLQIYIDVTQAYGWTGRAAGIIRVMDEVSSKFAIDNRFSTTYVVWDKVKHDFIKVDFISALENRGVDRLDPNSTQQAPSMAKKLVAKVPGSRRVYKLTKKSIADIQTETLKFSDSSILFMPHGGVWESKEYSARTKKLKERQNIRLINIVYDLNPVVVPQFCSPGIRKVFKEHMLQALPGSDLVLSISKNTSKDLRKWLKESKKTIPQVVEFRLGDEITRGSRATKPEGSMPKDFILCAGTIEARKNHTALYYAYKLAHEKVLELPTIVIVGKVGWLAEDIYEIIKNDPTVSDKFIFLHNTSDEELAWLYSNAQFTVYPAFYEGWGLPVAESLLHGTPVLTSNTSSLPEIAGDLVEYFSPYSPEQIMGSIHKYSSNPTLRTEKAHAIKTNYKTTTWNSSYSEVAEAILKLKA